MSSSPRLVTVFGGSGFVGQSVVQRLAAQGDRVRVAVRRPNEALFLKPMGAVGQVQVAQANVRDAASVARAVKGADVVINLVGILFERGKQKFETVQATGAATIARAAAEAGVQSLVHVSAIGADPESKSAYARAKGEAEAAVQEAFPSAAILRPSVIFGPGDDFLNRFAGLARSIPLFMPVVGAETKLQPVYVGDVAEAIVGATAGKGAGKICELGGPRTYTMQELLDYIASETTIQKTMIPLPWFMAGLLGLKMQIISSCLPFFFPKPQLTADQVKLLKHNNVVSDGAQTLADFGITPTPMEAIAPTYLVRYRPHGQWSSKEAG